jgi:hypothetical protein
MSCAAIYSRIVLAKKLCVLAGFIHMFYVQMYMCLEFWHVFFSVVYVLMQAV